MQRPIINKSIVVDNSNYEKDYHKEKIYDKPKRAKPLDELKFVGPVPSLSSYE